MPPRGRVPATEVLRGVSGDPGHPRLVDESRVASLVLDAVLDTVILHGMDGTIVHANEAACRVHGYTRDEMLAMNLRQLVGPGFDDLITVRLEALRTARGATFESSDRRKDGAVIPVEVHARVVEIDGNELVLSMTRDISERKAAEARLQATVDELRRSEALLARLNADLEQRVEERTRTLLEAKDAMLRQEKLASIGKLASIVSHELRNPLSVITNAVHYLSMRLDTADETVTKHLGILREQADRAAKIVSDLLDHARVKHDEIADVHVNDVLDLVLRSIVVMPPGIEVRREYASDLPPLKLDERKLVQVFTNLVDNAFQAMNPGGVLTLATAREGGNVVASVSDTGPGIPPDVKDKMFEPLFSTKARGTGLGLTVVKEIVEGYGGRVDVASEVGKGSTFTVALPVR